MSLIPKYNKYINISKSLFIKGVQCKKALWLEKYKKDLLTPPDENLKAVFETGQKVGKEAQKLFPNGKDISLGDTSFSQKIKLTKEYMQQGVKNIYEATFSHNGLFAMVDILYKVDDGWEIYEVKSSTWDEYKNDKVIDKYALDVAFQYYLLNDIGINVTKSSLVLLDSSYVRGEELDHQKLFKTIDISNKVKSLQDDVANYIKEFKTILQDNKNEPDIDIGYHCDHPYTCNAKEYCWGQKELPEFSIFDLFSAKKAQKLYKKGIVDVKDIPEDFELSINQSTMVEAWKNENDLIDKEKIGEFLNKLSYPIYHFDFETYMEAIPAIEGTKPYQQIPFQYSLHIEYADGEIEHKEFLADVAADDPRVELVEQLVKDIPKDATVMAYNSSFEKRIFKSLAKAFPEHEEHLNSLIENIVDLAEPFQSKAYYQRSMKNSYSIKVVLPSVVSDMENSYKDLEFVSNGSEAMSIFPKLKEMDKEEQERYREALLKYCELDTFAMVKILEKLRDISKER